MKKIIVIALVALCVMGASAGKGSLIVVKSATIDHQQKMKTALGE